jgi:hypothetical protein
LQAIQAAQDTQDVSRKRGIALVHALISTMWRSVSDNAFWARVAALLEDATAMMAPAPSSAVSLQDQVFVQAVRLRRANDLGSGDLGRRFCGGVGV